MPNCLPPVTLTGAEVLSLAGLVARPVALAHGQIVEGNFSEVDLSDYLILPGIIDLHGDGFERHLAPRPSAPLVMERGLASLDREAAAHGVTTLWLAASWSWEGGPRGPDHAEALAAALELYRPRALTDLRLQIRAETAMVEAEERLIALIERHGIGYVIFNDHLAEGLAMAAGDGHGFAHWAAKCHLKADELRAVIVERDKQRARVPRHLCRLADAFDQLGVVYGSHDDPDAATRERYRMLGARISEFPTSREAAAAAKAMDGPVLMGAPNVVRGGSQAGNISARDLIAEGLCDALVSDYHLPSLAEAAWTLVDSGIAELAAAWSMISTRPAAILGLRDRGRIAPGQRADLVAVHRKSRDIELTVSGGAVVHASGEIAARLMGARVTRDRIAAE